MKSDYVTRNSLTSDVYVHGPNKYDALLQVMPEISNENLAYLEIVCWRFIAQTGSSAF